MKTELAITAELLAQEMVDHATEVDTLNKTIRDLSDQLTHSKMAEAHAIGELTGVKALLHRVEKDLQDERSKPAPAATTQIAPPEYVLRVDSTDETGRMKSLRLSPVKGKT